jgi:hypothetical protein
VYSGEEWWIVGKGEGDCPFQGASKGGEANQLPLAFLLFFVNFYLGGFYNQISE